MSWEAFVVSEWPNEKAPAYWEIKPTGGWVTPYRGRWQDGGPEFRGGAYLWVPSWLTEYYNHKLRAEDPAAYDEFKVWPASDLWSAYGWTGTSAQVLARCLAEMADLEAERDREMERVMFEYAVQGAWTASDGEAVAA